MLGGSGGGAVLVDQFAAGGVSLDRDGLFDLGDVASGARWPSARYPSLRGRRERLGISRNVLTPRLDALVAAGVLERRPYDEGGRRCDYLLTDIPPPSG